MHLKITFCSPHLQPGSSALTAGITIHYVSAGKGCKGPGRSSYHISLSRPVSEIIAGADKLPWSEFHFFKLSSVKQADVWGNACPAFRTRVLFLVPHSKSRSCPPSAFPGFFRGPSLIRHCRRLQSENQHGSRVEPRTGMFSNCI